MKYFGLTDEKMFLEDQKYMEMAKFYWGWSPLPIGAKIIGGYSDNKRAGVLIRLVNGNLVCGNAGKISRISK